MVQQRSQQRVVQFASVKEVVVAVEEPEIVAVDVAVLEQPVEEAGETAEVVVVGKLVAVGSTAPVEEAGEMELPGRCVAV